MILSPLKTRPVDIVICNPPFYASRQELEEGMKIKAVGPHAVSWPSPSAERANDRLRQLRAMS